MRFAFVMLVACVTLSSLTSAQARPRSQAPQLSPDCDLMMACQTPANGAAVSSDFGFLGAPGMSEATSPRQARAALRAERRAARQVAREQRREARAQARDAGRSGELRRADRRNASLRDANLRNAMAYAPAAAAMPEASDAPATGAEPVERESGASSRTSLRGVVPGLASKVAQIQATCPGAHVISTVRHTRIAGTRRLSLHATGEAVDMRGNPSCIYAQLRDWPGGYSTDYARARHVHISLSSSGREMGLRFAHGGGHRAHRHRRVAMR